MTQLQDPKPDQEQTLLTGASVGSKQYGAGTYDPYLDRYPNPSGVEPRGRAVLVRPYEPPKPESMIVIPEHIQKRQDTMNQRAVVIAVGPSCWFDEPRPRAQPGDHVLVTRFAGYNVFEDVSADGVYYRLVNDRDIFAVLTQGDRNG